MSKPKIAILSDEVSWGCGGGKYYDHVLKILGDDAVGLRLRTKKKVEQLGSLKNIPHAKLKEELEGIEQIWFGAIRNPDWDLISDVIVNHPAKKLAIHNLENMVTKAMKRNKLYEAEVKWDLQLIQRDEMRRVFPAHFKSFVGVPCVMGHATLEPEDFLVYDTIKYEDKEPMVVAASRWSSYKRSTQTFISLWAAANEGVTAEMWGVKADSLDMSQYHMLNAKPELKKVWDELVAKGCVKGQYTQDQKHTFLKRALLDIDFTTVSGKGKVYQELAHAQFVGLEAVQYRAIPIVCEDAYDDKLDPGYFRLKVPVNNAPDTLEASIQTGKELARLIKTVSKDEWEHKTAFNFEIMKKYNSWECLVEAVNECKTILSA